MPIRWQSLTKIDQGLPLAPTGTRLGQVGQWGTNYGQVGKGGWASGGKGLQIVC